MNGHIQLLHKSRLFYGIAPDEIESMLHCLSAKESVHKKGKYIHRQGDQITALSLLLDGEVHIEKEDFWGNHTILTEIVPGELFGEAYACIGAAPITVNVVAIKDSTILSLDVKRIITTCSSACVFHARLIQNLVTVIAVKNYALTAKLEHMSQRTTRDKLLSYLSEQAAKHGTSFDLPFNRQQLADYLAVDRSAMSNELSKMRRDGIIKLDKNHVVLR